MKAWMVLAAIVVAFLTACVGFGAVVLALDGRSCLTRWESSGLPVKWSVFGGCQVETTPGRWLPEKVLRDFDWTKKGATP